MPFIRQGTCNRCGQCCGANGSPNQTNPWPKNWPQTILAWPFSDFENVMSHASLVGLEEDPVDGTVKKIADYGQFNLRGDKIKWRWVDGGGLCKNLSPDDDPNTYNLECPLLGEDGGDGRRPCLLVGSSYEYMYTNTCYPEGPVSFRDQQSLDQWEADHPLCSHTWVWTEE